MDLERITVNIRGRTTWEAMDLGIAFLRNYWKPIYAIWVVFTLPLVFILCLCFQGHSWISILMLWWLKPLFDRLPLYLLSRILFGEIPSYKKVIKELPEFIFKNLLLDLTIFRFSPWRSFLLPAKHLEGLKAKPRRKRIRVLASSGRGSATLLTILCFIFEIGIFLGWYMLINFIFMRDLLNLL